MNSPPDRLIVHLSDQVEGGASIAASRLATGLTQIGELTERWFCTHDSRQEPARQGVMLEQSAKAPWPERLVKNFSRLLGRSMRRRRHERLLAQQISRRVPALLHIHNLHASGLNHESLVAVSRGLPLVWTLHDCFPVLPQAYEWVSEQGEHEVIGEDPSGSVAALASRAHFFSSRPDTVLVAPSRWMAGIARTAVPATVRIEIIPYGLPCPEVIPQAEARAQLGLPPNRMLLGFAAARFDRRKGGDRIPAMLRQAGMPECELVVWGDDAKWDWPSEITSHRFGLITEPRRLTQLYSSCDLFICPSRADNLPNTVLESLACGTPVIGSAVGGIPELVRSGETGWLFEGGIAESGAQALRNAVVQKAVWPDYRRSCRALVLKEFSMDICARKHSALYQELF